MKNQFRQIVQEKIVTGVKSLPSGLTQREALIPQLRGKAMTVIGMRRSGALIFSMKFSSWMVGSRLSVA